ncbi:hypothetical protein HUG17_7849 [Dermatophagoides farinae]|uniref:Uncharacterized protein n=1 Tax=Dermatophagoides farinae TaxID=6954 RepID=A0A9D4NY39_DERFA|nr:hypothetical protein HUG17_7849 [Dermatophagoides farinae]
MSFVFNDDYLQFRILPNKIEEIDWERDKDFIHNIHDSKKNEYVIHDLHNGIRTNVDEKGYRHLVCVICDIKLSNWNSVKAHITNVHDDMCQLLRRTRIKPIVGIDQIEEYRDNENKMVEYKCNLCDLFYAPKYIFWHIISFDHKENFFKTLYSIDFINQINDGRLKHEKIDKALLNYEKDHPDRGYFQQKEFHPGMVASHFGIKHKMNINYVQRLYPQETKRVHNLESQIKYKRPLNIQILSDRQFEQEKFCYKKLINL